MSAYDTTDSGHPQRESGAVSNPLTTLPAVDVVLRHVAVRMLLKQLPRVQVVQCVRQVLDKLRTAIHADSQSSTDVDDVAWQVIMAAQRLLLRKLGPVINATGIILHTNLGRSVLADDAIDRIVNAARSSNLELSLENGKRARRGAHAEDLLTTLTGAEDALVVNNCAAATMLALQGIAKSREVIISRGQLVEIGGGFRLPDVFQAAGVVLKEVGTTNRTRIEDYAGAVSHQTAAILRVHRSNFRTSGFVAEPTVSELVQLAQDNGLPMIDDLGSGCITPLNSLGLNEPHVPGSLRAGADLVLFSGDKLLGGPQAGILIGRKRWIEQLRSHPMTRAMRVCKLTLAGLEATLELHLSDAAFDSVPTLRMLATPAASIRDRCQALVKLLAQNSDAGRHLLAETVSCESKVGGGSLADQTLDSFAVRLTRVQPQTLLQQLRMGTGNDGYPATRETPVLGRITDGSVLLDLRTVRPEDDTLITERLCRLAAESAGAER